jgi:hypothetical protein
MPPGCCGLLAGGGGGSGGWLGVVLDLLAEAARATLNVSDGAKLLRVVALTLSFCIFSWSAPKSNELSTSSNLVSCGKPLICVAILSGNAILSVGCVMVSLIISSYVGTLCITALLKSI